MPDEHPVHDTPGQKRKTGYMGRNELLRQPDDKRQRIEQQEEARRRRAENGEDLKAPIYATHFSQEDIESEQRRPKKKAAILLSYSGTGYHGMQLSENVKTIEGELFPALVAAGAISKANAADPKKSSLVRCARTDKGVHAAGNVVSLKMMVDDPDLIKKVNDHLSPQIRIWNVQVTNKSFSCYTMCDSRVYEYLIPSHCLLPPHPTTYVGKKLQESAEKEGDLEGYSSRQEEVATFWEDVNEKYLKPVLETVHEDIRELVEKAFLCEEGPTDPEAKNEDQEAQTAAEEPEDSETWPREIINNHPRRDEIMQAMKAVNTAYREAKANYRVPAPRLARLQTALDKYVGTKNYFNYTIQKKHDDPSAKRHIKSFTLNQTPIMINGTEWLSLKVHGQSFMMHQIRKMVSMAVQVVRCGCVPERITESFRPTKIGIPKAPALGLLLERPVFNGYNKTTEKLGKEEIDFAKYEDGIAEFKQREIYSRIFAEEDQKHTFVSFFNHVDSYPQPAFLFITSSGIPAAKLPTRNPPGNKDRKSGGDPLAEVEGESGDEGPIPDNGEEGG